MQNQTYFAETVGFFVIVIDRWLPFKNLFFSCKDFRLAAFRL